MTQCFRQINGGNVTSFLGVHTCDNFASATNFNTCCFNGHICVGNGLCYAPTPDAGTTGFYEGLCSDPTYQDASCGKRCTAWVKGDGVWDASLQAWRCCGDDSSGHANCQNPTTVTFSAPSPSVLLAAATGSSATSSSTSSKVSTSSQTSTTSTISSSVTITPSSSSTSTASNNTPSTGLSTGATAGIGVGVALVALGVIAAVAWTIITRRRRRQVTHQPTGSQVPQDYKYDSHRVSEMGPAPSYYAAEMSNERYSRSKPSRPYPNAQVHEMAS